MIRSLDSFRARVVSVEPTSVHFTEWPHSSDFAFSLSAKTWLVGRAEKLVGRDVDVDAYVERDRETTAVVSGVLDAMHELEEGSAVAEWDAWWAAFKAAGGRYVPREDDESEAAT